MVDSVSSSVVYSGSHHDSVYRWPGIAVFAKSYKTQTIQTLNGCLLPPPPTPHPISKQCLQRSTTVVSKNIYRINQHQPSSVGVNLLCNSHSINPAMNERWNHPVFVKCFMTAVNRPMLTGQLIQYEC